MESVKHVNRNRHNFVSQIQQMTNVRVNFRRKMYLIPFTPPNLKVTKSVKLALIIKLSTKVSIYYLSIMYLFPIITHQLISSGEQIFYVYSQNIFKKYLKVIINTAKIFSLMITLTLHVFEPNHDFNYI